MTKKARNIAGIVLWIIMATSQVAGFVLALIVFQQLFPVEIHALDPLAVTAFDFLEHQFGMFALVMAMLILNATITNRFATNILAHEESRFRARQFTIIERMVLAFKWKNERTALASGNETLMKVKNASTSIAFFSILTLICTYFLPDFQVQKVMEYVLTGNQSLLSTLFIDDFIAAALYVVFVCGLLAISVFLSAFYSGRAMAYQGQHYWLQRRYLHAVALKTIGYAVSFSPLLPALLYLVGVPPYIAMVATIPASLAGTCAWLVILFIFWKRPDELALDPKARAIKERAGLIVVPQHRGRSAGSIDRLKAWGFWFLLLSVMGLSVVNGAIWFPATIMYAQATDWYEWGFYWWAGILVVAGPVILLVFLHSVYARRVLMGYLIGMLLVMAIEVATVLPLSIEPAAMVYAAIFPGLVGFTRWADPFSSSGRPMHVIGLIGGVIVALVALFIVKRKAIPIPITTPKHPAGFSSWRNLVSFITGRGEKDTVRNVVAVVFLATSLAGVCLTFQPPVTITLERPASNPMRVSFWDSGFRSPSELPNSTLSILGNNNIRLYGWFSETNLVGAARYASFGIEVVDATEMPENETELAQQIAALNATMNFWDAHGLRNKPFIGFTFDHEEMRGLARFNATRYATMKEMVRQLADFITGRGYQLFSTTYLMTINDLLDGDEDVSTINFVPFDPAWNVSHFDWMVYRTELAIEYDEPSPVFTYEWARWIKHFMLRTGGPALFAKASMSIGVTSNELPLYRDPGGLDEFLMDVKICHAMGIPEIKIFYLGKTSEMMFLGKWGNAGLIRMLGELQNYTSVSFPFVRRATFFGNLKGTENPTGSVFGFMYQDFWLEESIGLLTIMLFFVILVLPTFFACIGARVPLPRATNPRRCPDVKWLDSSLVAIKITTIVLVVILAIWIPLSFMNFEFFTWDFNEFLG
ncbi:MAG: hypothetical protein Q6370_010120 [Candidatus Sigynarchaeota archaeon]